jgi:predicted nuclease of predicted toxin-antitoxin system
VRLLLDAHVSGRKMGDRLNESGHDVRALDREPDLEALDDNAVLELASMDQRVLVTFNVADFPTILREWGIAGRPHAGIILAYGIDHSEFDLVVRGVERWLVIHSKPKDWSDRAVVLSRDFDAIEA